MKDYNSFQFPELDSNNRLRFTILEVGRVIVWILSFVLLFYFLNTVLILEKNLDNGFYRLAIMLICQLITLKYLSNISYKKLAFISISIMYLGFFLYPFLDISRRFEENIYLPLVLLIFGMTLPILYYNARKDTSIIVSWMLLIFSTVVINLIYQYSIANQSEHKFFVIFENHPMTIIGFFSAILFLVISFFNYRRYNSTQYDVILELNKSLNDKLIEIYQKGNEKETQNEELKSIQEELLAIKEGLEEKVRERTEELKEQQKEIIRYGFMNSHILRAPIARIKGLMDIAQKLKEGSERGNILELIRESIRELDNTSQSINEIINKQNKDQLKIIERKVEQLYGGKA
ncbi:coiled-coil domain-containing protein [Fulvivirga lutimaris]|uniref:coiled-coil domain-containing protein n=1 Tax=Fulvivirga lutimaris TaxID=1819566 RepID=UPI0012BC7304|nr:hypothetical protein [Fulvivirga lutimaris]MTI40253.1 hypothetical protein [Fulvivirga lutimaris]